MTWTFIFILIFLPLQYIFCQKSRLHPLQYRILSGIDSYWHHPESGLEINVTLEAHAPKGLLMLIRIYQPSTGVPTKTIIETVRTDRTAEEQHHTFKISNVVYLEDYIYQVIRRDEVDHADETINLAINYILCANEDKECQDAPTSCQDGRVFCLQSIGSCESLEFVDKRSRCSMHDYIDNHRVCTNDGTMFNSLCSGYNSATSSQIVRSILPVGFPCGALEFYFEVASTGTTVFVGSYHNRADPLKIRCTSTSFTELQLLEVEVREFHNETKWTSVKTYRCNDLSELDNNNTRLSELAITRLSMNVITDIGTVSTFINLVKLNFTDQHVKFHMCNRTLKCFITVPIGGIFKASITLYKQYNKPDEEPFKNTTEKTLRLEETGIYVCLAIVRFRACSPFTTWMKVVEQTTRINSLEGCPNETSTFTLMSFGFGSHRNTSNETHGSGGHSNSTGHLTIFICILVLALIPAIGIMTLSWHYFWYKRQLHLLSSSTTVAGSSSVAQKKIVRKLPFKK